MQLPIAWGVDLIAECMNKPRCDERFWEKLWRRDVSELRNPPEGVSFADGYAEAFSKYGKDWEIFEFIGERGAEKLLDIVRREDSYGSDYLKRFTDRAASNVLSGAAQFGHSDLVEDMLKLNMPINELNSAVFEAAMEGQSDVVKLLLAAWAYPAAALMGAAKGGQTELIAYLIQKGARDINSALRDAAEMGHLDAVLYLLQVGAKPTRRDVEAVADPTIRDLLIAALDRKKL
jgi:hypothetical protein